ncbi:MAG: hypothetical protein H6R14_2274 [Proteobacteria bacterium]|nr:hypothetical protein [Pseudomonadota bacterium]
MPDRRNKGQKAPRWQANATDEKLDIIITSNLSTLPYQNLYQANGE